MNSKPQTWDAVIIGAGAAGLMGAASTAARGRNVLLLEKNKKLGVKILMSGGTRCNITHNCSSRAIADAFGPQGKFLLSPLASLPPEEVIRKIESCGVETKIESTGKIFPVSNKSIDVRDALVKLARDADVTIHNEQPVVEIRRITGIGDAPIHEASDDATDNASEYETQFLVRTVDRVHLCKKLLITTGGKSYPGCGTTGDGYAWAKQFGHSIVRTVPALTPITCNERWVNKLKGITLDDVAIEVWNSQDGEPQPKKQKPLDTRRGSLLFTHFGFSGPPALNASKSITKQETPKGLKLHCDFLPMTTSQQLVDDFQTHVRRDGKQNVGTWMSQHFPRRLADALIDKTSVSRDQKLAEVSKRQSNQLIETLKRCKLPINGTLGFNKAEVTAGGVSLKEIDSRDMQSKIQPGLYFAGEILDLDGPIGGFNFQSAFSTGWLAGKQL